MKLVGDAVRQGQFYIQDKGNQSMSRGLKLIGLTSWGYVKNNMNLINTGGFQLEFVSITRVINHMTCYNSSALIVGKFIFQKKTLQDLSSV